MQERLEQMSVENKAALKSLEGKHSEALASIEQQHLTSLNIARAENEQLLKEQQTEHARELQLLMERHDAQERDMKSELASVRELHAALEVNHQDLTSERDEIRRAAEEAHASHRDLLKANEDLQAVHADTLKDLERGTSQLRDFVSKHESIIATQAIKLEKAQAVEQDLRQRVLDLEAQVATSREELDTAGERLAALQRTLDAQIHEHNGVLQQLTTVQAQSGSQLSTLRDERIRLEEEVEQLKTDLHAASSINTSMRDQGSVKSSPISQKSGNITYLSKQLPPPTPPPSMAPPPIPSTRIHERHGAQRASDASTVTSSHAYSTNSESTLAEAKLASKIEEHEAQVSRARQTCLAYGMTHAHGPPAVPLDETAHALRGRPKGQHGSCEHARVCSH